MNFTYEGANLGEVIKKYEKSGNNYKIEYLDGSTSSYVSFNEKEEKNIINLMLNQAVEREEQMILNDEYLDNMSGYIILGLGSLCFAFFARNNQIFLPSLLILPTVFGVYIATDNTKTLKELKKYKMFLEMIKDNPKPQLDISWSNLPGEERLYKMPVMNINTLDDFEYSDVKCIYKEFKSSQKNKKYK